jgi:tryptophan synthase alpha chain
VGFGLREKADAEFLKGKADIAVIGSETIRVAEENGVSAAGQFMRSIL